MIYNFEGTECAGRIKRNGEERSHSCHPLLLRQETWKIYCDAGHEENGDKRCKAVKGGDKQSKGPNSSLLKTFMGVWVTYIASQS